MWWMAARVATAEPNQTPPRPDGQEARDSDEMIEVIVSGQRLSEANEAVRERLHGEGYFKLIGLGERSFFVNSRPWKPWVMVHEQGFARIRGVPVMPLPPGPSTMLDPYGEPLPKPSGGVTANFQTQSMRAVRNQRERLAEKLEPLLADVRDAHWEIAKFDRIAAVRDSLARIWFDETSPEGVVLPNPAARREAIAALWLHTEPDEAGALIRGVVGTFIDEEVQTSSDPFLPDEVAEVDAARSCTEPFSPALPRRELP